MAPPSEASPNAPTTYPRSQYAAGFKFFAPARCPTFRPGRRDRATALTTPRRLCDAIGVWCPSRFVQVSTQGVRSSRIQPPGGTGRAKSRHVTPTRRVSSRDPPPVGPLVRLSSFAHSAPVQRIRVMGLPTSEQSPREFAPRLLFRGGGYSCKPPRRCRSSRSTRAIARLRGPRCFSPVQAAWGKNRKTPNASCTRLRVLCRVAPSFRPGARNWTRPQCKCVVQ